VGTLNYAWKMGQSGKVTLSSAGSFATNAMTKANTASWLSELATFATKPATVVGTLMASIGSYPFAGFIREEAIQVIGWAVSTALRNNDVEGAKVAQEAMKEALDPGLQDQIMAKIPFVNVLNELEGFFDGARINVAVNDKAIENMEFGVDAAQQQADQDNATVDYYNSERIKMLKWQREAEIQGRNEDAAFWAKERAKQRKLEEEDRKAIADFWFAYKKRLQELYEESRPSNLKFGLL
ncbi:MAG: hypothetical protein KAS32_28905, partial [Candidatus Peribacteraceae bacterium]|nr:hypothetical protein [Candidatus Peribacteraceae bacterium]